MRKIKGKTIALLTVAILIIAIAVLWITGPIPSFIIMVSTENYVEANYSNLGLKFAKVYWDSMWESYFASFTDEAGKIYNFRMSDFFPYTSVIYDPINPPG